MQADCPGLGEFEWGILELQPAVEFPSHSNHRCSEVEPKDSAESVLAWKFAAGKQPSERPPKDL